jgi:general stress protein CsbA
LNTPQPPDATPLPTILVSAGEWLENAISTQWVVFIVVPALIALGSILLKRHAKKKRETDPIDKLFGFDLGLTACLALLASGFVLVSNTASNVTAADRQHYITGLFLLLTIFVVAMIVGASVMHKRGWDDNTPPKWRGVMGWVINGGGVIFLIIAFVVTGGTFK